MTDQYMNELIPRKLVELVEFVTSELGEAASAISDQIRTARIVNYSSTNIDIVVLGDAPIVPLPNGPTPGRAIVWEKGVPMSEVMVWIRDGRVIGLEQPWYTEEPPGQWPQARDVMLET